MKKWSCIFIFLSCTVVIFADGKIDRFALVNRHNVNIEKVHAFSPLSVGNGRFVFTADVTGLQTFPEAYKAGIPLTTMAEWGWHSFPNTEGYELADTFVPVDTYGRKVLYDRNQKCPAASYLRANPHQISLGLLGMVLTKQDGTQAGVDDIEKIQQELNLWRGMLTSRFEVEGQPVTVETCVNPDEDQIAVRIQSPLIQAGRLKLSLKFPYAAGTWGTDPADWTSPQKHQTTMERKSPSQAVFERTMDDRHYMCYAAFSKDAKLTQAAQHEYTLTPSNQKDTVECSVVFRQQPGSQAIPNVGAVQQRCADYWNNFWMTGGAIDLSKSTDPRAKELERRIVLSQYLTAIQSAQKYPPQETGLTCNSWFGKFHLEMHWWHSVHFTLWDRLPLFERSLDWYRDILPAARSIAQRQGYKGVRWPKMTNPNGEDSPSGVGPMLIWQQPHPIYYAELVYRQKPDRETLEKYKDIVFETADFMADFAHWDAGRNRYVLGPPLIPAQENYNYTDTFNPTYELCYWYWGLQTAQKWRDRLGMEPDEKWERVCQHLSSLPVRDGVYTAIEPKPYTNTTDHPSMLAAFGLLPKTPLVDIETMRKTAQHVYDTWQWPDTWGWDYPMLAMTAARVGLPELAVDAFFIDSKKNLYWPNGHNYQRENLPLYLPGNGGLLTAVAMMAAGWDGAPDRNAPGFPDNGQWVVQWEDLQRMP